MVGVGVTGVAEGVDWKIWVRRTSAVWAAAVYMRSGLVVGEAVAFEPHPIRMKGMTKTARVNKMAFFFIISPEQFGAFIRPCPRSFNMKQVYSIGDRKSTRLRSSHT